MKIFIDSADMNEIKSLNDPGLVDGVTTVSYTHLTLPTMS